MARIIYSALVTRLRGSLGGSTFANWKGIEVIKRKVMRPRNPRSLKTQSIRGIINTLSGNFYSFSETSRAAWNVYGSMLKKPMSGFNAYIRNNSALAYYNIATGLIVNPPASVNTPDYPTGLAITDVAGVTTIVWTAPTDATLTVVYERALFGGLDNSSSPRWSFIKIAGADALTLTHTHGMIAGQVYYARVKVIDTSGRQSPRSGLYKLTSTTP